MGQVLGFQGMPHIPGFQFWAARSNGNAPPFAPPPETNWSIPGAGIGGGLRFYTVTLAANTAHAMLGALVTLQLVGNITAVFEFTETTAAPGNIAVVVANNATASQCATALETALGLYFAATFGGVPFFGAVGTNPVQVVIGQAAAPQLALAVGATLPITVTNNGGRQYGDPLLRNACKAFVFNNYDPNAVSVFGVVDGVPPDILIIFWPLTPVIPKAFPAPIVNTTVNEKPEG